MSEPMTTLFYLEREDKRFGGKEWYDGERWVYDPSYAMYYNSVEECQSIGGYVLSVDVPTRVLVDSDCEE